MNAHKEVFHPLVIEEIKSQNTKKNWISISRIKKQTNVFVRLECIGSRAFISIVSIRINAYNTVHAHHTVFVFTNRPIDDLMNSHVKICESINIHD